MNRLLCAALLLRLARPYVLEEGNATELLEYVLLDAAAHPCARSCVRDAPPMVCRYRFRLEWYQTLSKACYGCPLLGEDCGRAHCVPGDGRKRPVMVVNRQMPGPSVEVSSGWVVWWLWGVNGAGV